MNSTCSGTGPKKGKGKKKDIAAFSILPPPSEKEEEKKEKKEVIHFLHQSSFPLNR